MSGRFNSVLTGTKTTNLAGGKAFSQSNELELLSILLTSWAQKQYYRDDDVTFQQIRQLLKKVDPEFAAKAAVYARNEFGMRSITHCLASEIAPFLSGKSYAKDFYASIVHRPDDMMEILSYHFKGKNKIPNSMKKGFAKAFDKFSKYQLAKYRASTKEVKLVDVVNLVHPNPTEKNSEAIEALVKNQLKSFDTWETALTAAGQLSESDSEKAELKEAAWADLLTNGKLGYFAALRNCRNIIQQAPNYVNQLVGILTDGEAIKKSLVLPFRYLSAFREIQQLPPSPMVRAVIQALVKAVDIAVSNVPKLESETLVVLDTSSSMNQPNLGDKSPNIIGALFSAVLAKSNNCDFMTFDTTARYVNLTTVDSSITIANSIPFRGGGTNFHSIFQAADKKYDNIIILSDMQGWMGHHSPSSTFSEYKKRFSADPKIYSFDLAGYGTMQFPERNVYCLAGFSEKCFDIMGSLENGKLVDKIKALKWI